MNEKVELPGLVLLSDEPTPDHTADGLGMRRYAEVIAGAALNTPGPFTIGIFGGWGVGKTSVLKQAQSLIEQHAPEAVTVWFNAWQYDHEEHPLVPLALTIAEDVEAKIPEDDRYGKAGRWITLREIGTALRAVASGLKVKTPFLEIEGKEILAQLDRLESGPEIPSTIYLQAFSLLKRASAAPSDPLDASSKPPIVVFIDDLDRCMPRHALRLLQSIRLVLGQPGFVFVLALDREPIVCHLVNEYKRLEMKDPEASGPAYLEKIVQLPLWIPPHQTEFSRFIGRLMEADALKGNKQLCTAIEGLTDVLAIGTEANPRTLVRLINRLIADQHLLDDVLRNEGNGLGLCAVSRLLRQRLDMADYLSLVRDQQICDELIRQESKDGLKEETARERWRELRRMEPELLTPQDDLRLSISARLDRTPSIGALLGTAIGREWLENRDARLSIERMLAVETSGSLELSGEGIEAIERAIRSSLQLPASTPITAEHRAAVTDLRVSSDPVADTDLAYLEGLTSLTTLNLGETQVSDAGLEHLKELTSLTTLCLWETRVTDAGLEHLKRLTALTELQLSRTQVTGAGLEHLKGLTSLTTLNLGETQVSDAGLEHLQGLTSLTNLILVHTDVGDVGLEHLGWLPSLTRLSLWGTRVADAGLEHLKAMPLLWLLDLSGTRVTDVGLGQLGGLPSLRSLNLLNLHVTDIGLAHLGKLPSLEILNLSGRQVTDAGLEHLKGLKSLTDLWLDGTQVTDAAVDALRAAIPGLKVTR